MTCGESNGALLNAFETQARLVDDLRSARLRAAWRAELLDQANRGRRTAFDSWRAHLAEPIDLDVESAAGYTTIQYGAILRIVPAYAIRSERGLQLVSEALWEGEHPRPVSEECAFAWLQAQEAGVAALAGQIAERCAAEP
jgi:hypothetical protein